MSMIVFSGCGSDSISNELITINQYKKLEVDVPSDDEDELAIKEYEDTIWDELLANCVVEEYPQEELEKVIEELETQYSHASYYRGMKASELIEEIHGMTVEEYAKEQLKKEYAVALIAEEEGLTLTSEEYEEELEKLAKKNDVDSSDEYEDMYGYEELYQTFLEERVMDFLKENL